MANPLFNTKFTVPYKDVRAVQRELFNNDVGFELALAKDFQIRKFKSSVYCIIDNDGYLRMSEIDDSDFEDDYFASASEEICWEFVFHM